MSDQNLFEREIIGRDAELHQACQILAADGDLLLAGVPGMGRKTLIRAAAATCQAKVIEIDCLRATSYDRFLRLMAEAFTSSFHHPTEQSALQTWCNQQQFTLSNQAQLQWPSGDNWAILQRLLTLPQAIAQTMQYRVVLVFQNFPHLRSWDKRKAWEQYLKQQIHVQPEVSYTLIATVAESFVEQTEMQVLSLKPIAQRVMEDWLTATLGEHQIKVEIDAAQLFAAYIQGHFGSAIALAEQIRLAYQARSTTVPVQAQHIHASTIALVENLATTFESLILLLPPTQIRVLESLALDPTGKPQAREYIQKHDLSRGGTLQGALASLVQKGLIYDAEERYRLALPLLAFWLKHRLR